MVSSSPSTKVLLPITAFADADWGGCEDTRRSRSGCVIKLGNCVVDHISRKQDSVLNSSCAAEYVSIGVVVRGVLWMNSLLKEMGFAQGTSSVKVLNDNQSAIAIAKNDGNHNRVKHIDLTHHFIKDEIQKKVIQLDWIRSEDQIADILTKTLGGQKFTKLRDMLVTEYNNQSESFKGDSLYGGVLEQSESCI